MRWQPKRLVMASDSIMKNVADCTDKSWSHGCRRNESACVNQSIEETDILS